MCPKLTVAEAKSRGLLPGRTRRSGATLPPLAEPSDVRPPSRWTRRRRLSNVARGATEGLEGPTGKERDDSYASEAHGSARGIAVLEEKNVLDAIAVEVSVGYLYSVLRSP